MLLGWDGVSPQPPITSAGAIPAGDGQADVKQTFDEHRRRLRTAKAIVFRRIALVHAPFNQMANFRPEITLNSDQRANTRAANLARIPVTAVGAIRPAGSPDDACIFAASKKLAAPARKSRNAPPPGPWVAITMAIITHSCMQIHTYTPKIVNRKTTRRPQNLDIDMGNAEDVQPVSGGLRISAGDYHRTAAISGRRVLNQPEPASGNIRSTLFQGTPHAMSHALPGISRISCRAISLPENNLDSNTIIALRFPQAGRAGAANRPCVLVTGTNFGHGASHEQAVAALRQRGFQAVIAPSFGEMFLANCIYRRLLPAQVEPDIMPSLHEAANRDEIFSLDVAESTVCAGAGPIRRYTLPAAYRDALLHGVDEDDPVWVRYREALATYRKSRET